jgi:sporulation protein YlmC with PRC-barrel domain
MTSAEQSILADDVRGMVVVDANRHRLGEVEDLVVDDEGRVRLLSVVSGGVLGLDTRTRAIPIEAVTRVDDRVHVDLHRAAAYSRLR